MIFSGQTAGHKSIAETLWQAVFNYATIIHLQSTKKQKLDVFSAVISNMEVGSFFHVFYYIVISGKNVLEMDEKLC